MPNVPEILKLPNHALVKRVLRSFGGDVPLESLDSAVEEQVRCWFRLAKKHEHVARRLASADSAE